MDAERANAMAFGLLVVLGLASASMAGSVWGQRQRVPGSGPLVITMLATSFLLLSYGMSFAAISGPIVAWCLNFSYLGWLIAPPAVLAFVAQVTDRDRWLHPVILVLMGVIGLGFASLIWGPLPSTIFFGIGRDPITYEFDATPGFLAFYAYSLLLLLVAFGLILAELRHPRAMNTRQAVLVLVALGTPVVLSVLAALNVSIAHVYANMPILFVTSALLYTVAHYRPMDLRGLAESGAEATGAEGIVVFGTDRRISQMNAAAVRLLGPGRSPAMGLRVEEVWSDAPDILSALRSGPVNLVAVKDKDGVARHLLFRRSEVRDAQHDVVGWLVRVRDADTLTALGVSR